LALPDEEMSRLRRRGFLLEHASMAWMTVEAAVAIVSGILAASIALIGFGLDSVIEFFAAAVVVWQLRGAVSEDRETRALRLIGGTFFALAAYLTIESITDLVSRHRPEQSMAGIAVTAAALVVMPLLALAKRRTGQQLSNQALVADAAESAFCAFTSAAALLGIGLNSGLGWWWADPAAALVIAGLAVREGLEAWQEDTDLPIGPQRELATPRDNVRPGRHGPGWETITDGVDGPEGWPLYLGRYAALVKEGL
jgi:divalent metal cation (Fe/Co/Zn/Cd) transporter